MKAFMEIYLKMREKNIVIVDLKNIKTRTKKNIIAGKIEFSVL